MSMVIRLACVLIHCVKFIRIKPIESCAGTKARESWLTPATRVWERLNPH